MLDIKFNVHTRNVHAISQTNGPKLAYCTIPYLKSKDR